MNNIQKTAIRLIANAFLFAQEKQKPCHSYRFDSSILTSRGLTSIKDLELLQEELSKRGWFFNILAYNDFVIHEKLFIAELVKLGFGRVKDKTDEEIEYIYKESVKLNVLTKISALVQASLSTFNVSMYENNTVLLITDSSGIVRKVFISFYEFFDDHLIVCVSYDFTDEQVFDIPYSYSGIKELSSKIVYKIKENC